MQDQKSKQKDTAPLDQDGEESLIARHFAPLTKAWPGAFNLSDDCAAILPAPGQELILKTDPVRAGVHFFPDDDPQDIAWKALAVNVSDLAAKAARPLAYLLAISFPEKPSGDWLQAFTAGLERAQRAFGCVLIGGDTDRGPGPLSIAVTVVGESPAGRMIRRGGAMPGDLLFVSGTLGDAATGLMLRSGLESTRNWPIGTAARSALIERYLRPIPRLGLRAALRASANAAMDISDGLAKDLARMCRASGCSARVELAALPRSVPVHGLVEFEPGYIETMIGAGDDYEILAAVPPQNAESFVALATAGGVPVAAIGSIIETRDASAVTFFDAEGAPFSPRHMGYDHF
jgi:thiamine-monophosphate kinase